MSDVGKTFKTAVYGEHKTVIGNKRHTCVNEEKRQVSLFRFMMAYLSCLQQDLPLLLFLPLLLQLVELLKELQLSPNVTALLIAVILLLKDGVDTMLHQKKSMLNLLVIILKLHYVFFHLWHNQVTVLPSVM